jgi:hypothetical protein
LNGDSLRDYVNWGGPHHANVAMAEQVGLWKHGEYLPAHTAPGFSYQFCDRVQESAGAWDSKAATVGVLNVCLLVPTPVETTTWGKVKARYSN